MNQNYLIVSQYQSVVLMYPCLNCSVALERVSAWWLDDQFCLLRG